MTRLLVSVRNADEALAALAGGADVIDIKEPNRGALGAADPAIWRSAVQAVDSQTPVSVALGELCDFHVEKLSPDFAQSLAGVSWAKLGLAGCAQDGDWRQRWGSAIAALPQHVQSVAVIYADWLAAAAPSPDQVLAAAQGRASVVLIDTFDKSTGHLLDHLSLHSLAAIAEQARANQLKLALAGSLRMELIAEIVDVAPDYIAVRGAACEGGRDGRVSKQLVERLSSAARRLQPSGAFVATRIA